MFSRLNFNLGNFTFLVPIVLVLGWASNASAVDAGLEIVDADGNRVDGEYDYPPGVNAIEVLSWGWGVSPSKSKNDTACVYELVITKPVDAASDDLLTNAVIQEPFQEATLFLEENPSRVARLRLLEPLVSSITNEGESDDDRLTETVRLNFLAARFELFLQDATGALISTGRADVVGSNANCN
jgi:type VI protein secretion system component Hcp